MMLLYHSARSSASYRVRIALAWKGIEYESRLLDMQARHHTTSAYRAVNPMALVPALDVDGRVFTESLAIIEYLEEMHAEPRLLPADASQRAYARAVSQLIACEIHPLNNLRALEYLRKFYGQDEEGVRAWYRHWIAEGLSMLERLLAREQLHGRYCLGDRVSMADCCVVPQVANAQRYACDLSPYPAVMRIHEACVRLPEFVRASPENQTHSLWLSASEAP